MVTTLKTRKVFLDTECFHSGGFNFLSKPFRILTSLAAKGEVEVYVTDITVREVQAHITEAVVEAVRAHKRFGGETRILRNCKSESVIQALAPLDEVAVKDELLAQFKSFLTGPQVTVLATDDLTAGPILKSYFQSQAPFGPGKKKAEFPDAFTFAAVKRWCDDNNDEMYVISRDGDLRDACNKDGPLYNLQKLPDFLNLLASDDESLTAFLRSEIEQHTQEIKERIGKAFTSELEFILEGQDGDVAHVRVSDVSLDEAEVLQASINDADFELEADVQFHACLSYGDPDTAVWNSEDKTQMFIGTAEEEVEREEPVRVEISASFQGLDPDSFKITNVSFAESKGPISVRSTVDAGWPYK